MAAAVALEVAAFAISEPAAATSPVFLANIELTVSKLLPQVEDVITKLSKAFVKNLSYPNDLENGTNLPITKSINFVAVLIIWINVFVKNFAHDLNSQVRVSVRVLFPSFLTESLNATTPFSRAAASFPDLNIILNIGFRNFATGLRITFVVAVA
jgi:hypothetical protein